MQGPHGLVFVNIPTQRPIEICRFPALFSYHNSYIFTFYHNLEILRCFYRWRDFNFNVYILDSLAPGVSVTPSPVITIWVGLINRWSTTEMKSVRSKIVKTDSLSAFASPVSPWPEILGECCCGNEFAEAEATVVDSRFASWDFVSSTLDNKDIARQKWWTTTRTCNGFFYLGGSFRLCIRNDSSLMFVLLKSILVLLISLIWSMWFKKGEKHTWATIRKLTPGGNPNFFWSDVITW